VNQNQNQTDLANPSVSARPLWTAYRAALATYAAAVRQRGSSEDEVLAADWAMAQAYRVWQASDEPHTFTLRDPASVSWEVTATPRTYRDVARRSVLAGNDGSADSAGSTWWETVTISLADGTEYDTLEVAHEPTEPPCADDHEHDWSAPHWLLGGLKENPGVVGHGGGVLCSEVCGHCGCLRVTDTWAQDRQTGRQGLTSVAYKPGHHADDLRDRGLAAADAVDLHEVSVDLSDEGALYREGFVGGVAARDGVTACSISDEGLVDWLLEE
jgi:hypothetical protein